MKGVGLTVPVTRVNLYGYTAVCSVKTVLDSKQTGLWVRVKETFVLEERTHLG